MKATLIVIGGMFAIVAAGFFFTGTDLALKKFFDPKYEAVRRETFEQSKAYNQGMIQELQNMQFEYIKASPEHKTALKSIILHRAADYPMDDAPADLRNFIRELRSER
jgi:hypothetical protein